MSPEEKDMSGTQDTGKQVTDQMPRAAIDSYKAAKGAGKMAMKGAKEAAKIGRDVKKLGFKNGMKATANRAAGNAGNKIMNSAPVKAGKGAVELANIVKSKGAKAGAKALGKAAGKAATAVAKKALMGILLKFSLPLILIILIFAIVFANTPAIILSAVGSDTKIPSSGQQEKFNETVDQMNNAIHMDVVDSIIYLIKTAKNWYYEKTVEGNLKVQSTGQEVTQEEMDRLAQAGDYDGVLSFYTELVRRYLDTSYDDVVAEITKHANACAASNTTKNIYDADRTISSIGPNPFTNTDYANIIACYATTDDYDTALLSRFKDKLRKANFITYTTEKKSKTRTVKIRDKDGKVINKYKETTSWEEVTLVPYSTTKIFEVFGVDPNATYEKSLPQTSNLKGNDGKPVTEISYEVAYSEYYTTLHNKLEELGYTNADSGNSICGATFGSILDESQIKKYLDSLPAGTSGNRKQLIKVALDAVGRIPYNNTGERSYPKYGVNPNWGKPSSTSSIHPYVGIDCSGFVQWVYRNAWCSTTGDNPDSSYLGMSSTGVITDAGNKYIRSISKDELKPGDLGVLRTGGSSGGSWNHVGIYMGDGKWIHCSGGAGTVVLSSSYKSFKYFYRVTSDAVDNDNFLTSECYLPYMQNAWTSSGTGGVTDDQMTIIATTLHGEYSSDEGFRACAEAVYHYSRYNGKSMYETIQIKNYLDAYTRLYVKHTWDPNKKRATAGQLKMLEEVMKGNLTHFPSNRYPYPVMYFNTTDIKMTGWRAKGVIVEKIGKVVYFYCKGVTYPGYKTS